MESRLVSVTEQTQADQIEKLYKQIQPWFENKIEAININYEEINNVLQNPQLSHRIKMAMEDFDRGKYGTLEIEHYQGNYNVMSVAKKDIVYRQFMTGPEEIVADQEMIKREFGGFEYIKRCIEFGGTFNDKLNNFLMTHTDPEQKVHYIRGGITRLLANDRVVGNDSLRAEQILNLIGKINELSGQEEIAILNNLREWLLFHKNKIGSDRSGDFDDYVKEKLNATWDVKDGLYKKNQK